MRTWMCVCIVFLAAGPTSAQDAGIGLGLIAGEPTGLCMKAWTGDRTAFACAAAWSFAHDAAVHLHGDFLVHTYRASSYRHPDLPAYYGLGVRLKLNDDDSWLGMRIPLGIVFAFEDAPLDIFLELVPLMDLAPSTELRINAAIGVRYYFGGAPSEADQRQ